MSGIAAALQEDRIIEPRARPLSLVVALPLAQLRAHRSPRSRGLDADHVHALAEAIDALPPIIVHRATMRVIDGAHRVRAAEILGRTEINAQYFDGDDADAFVLAVKSNVTHGLPLSLTDRKAAAADILASHPQWSDRMIARVTGLSPKTVARCRSSVPEQRVGQDGRVRPANSLEKRRIARDLMREDPTLSLRQVARTAGISPETVRAVRTRMLRGEDPVRLTRAVPVASVPPPPPPAPAQPDWPSVLQRLRTDPSIRFTESGRALLRLMDAHAVNNGRWDAIAENVPPHCRHLIAQVASEFAQAWHRFAEQLERVPRM
ncbi:ParB/RepB/Spo0J family partition protein [Actinokineospora sp. HUAS TT18]|uniref:ParB/RepB/Spo0J family partition protein n=1 Tax=Actinokineospora sp. HUAS TT18 TaxID=3447451 RepID=UPI003F5259EB